MYIVSVYLYYNLFIVKVGDTILHSACSQSNPAVVELLLNKSPNLINSTNNVSTLCNIYIECLLYNYRDYILSRTVVLDM